MTRNSSDEQEVHTPLEPMNQKTVHDGSSPEDDGLSLTSTEAEILGLFKAGRNAAQIAAKRGCSHSYVARILKKLRKRGLVHAPVQGVGYTHEPHEPTLRSDNNLKRVHAQRFTFNIIRSGKRFKPQLAQKLKDGTFVQVSGKRLYVMAAKDRVFEGRSLDDALRAAIAWWSSCFERIEFDLDCVFWKARRAFEVSYTEVASEGSAVAREVMAREGHVKVFSDVDGKLRLSFDMSRARPEHEVHHAKSWRSDDESADHHFNAILDYGVDGATLPQLARLHADSVVMIQTQIRTVNMLVEQMKAAVPSRDLDDFMEADYFG